MDKFEEPKGLNMVAAFHDMFNLPVVDAPMIPDRKRCELRYALLAEELKELEEAIENNDLIEVADALADLQYVLSGAILEFGLAKNFSQLFSEVHRSNMSKTCKTYEEAKATQQFYLEQKNTESIVEEKNGEYLVLRSTDKKVLKSINYSSADIKGNM
ncbi:MAG TPA: nucleoside triphosphate pyrophosphohydrolase family protein [Saprospiraceae bacterium]|nr:nucleoside triphosphate pyrophosphohydrolase family protein [Saprospiraceae bacterium]